MTQPFKVCPQCHTPAEIDAVACAHCQRVFQSTSPDSKTQVFAPGGLPQRVGILRSPPQPALSLADRPVLTPKEVLYRYRSWIPLTLTAAFVVLLAIGILVRGLMSPQEDHHVISEFRTQQMSSPGNSSSPFSIAPETYHGPPSFMAVTNAMSMDDITRAVGTTPTGSTIRNVSGRSETIKTWVNGPYTLFVMFDTSNAIHEITVNENTGTIIRRWRQETFP